VLLLPGVGLDLPGIAGDGELDLADHLERLLLLLLGARAHEVRRIAVQRLRAKRICQNLSEFVAGRVSLVIRVGGK